MEFKYYPRGGGKSFLAKQMQEEILNKGGRVAVCSAGKTTVMRRKKHLTLIETFVKDKSK